MNHRKWICRFLLCCALLVSGMTSALAVQVNLSSLSNTELLELKQLLDAELTARGLLTSAEQNEPDEKMVWVPQSGSRYHAKPTCSNMEDPIEVPVSVALQCGFTPCKRCNPGM